MTAKPEPVLTIGMLTHEDYHGTWFTMQSIRMHHKEAMPKVRFVIVDNSPHSPHGIENKKYMAGMSDVDYHTVENVSSTSFRNLVFELAPTDAVLCLDSHVMIEPKGIDRLVRFYEQNPGFHDLIQGPLLAETNYVVATHMEPNWRGGNFGTWAVKEGHTDPEGEPFEIPMHGMGLFACSRSGWPRFAPGMRGFGAEEGTIHEQFRHLGRKTWCFPFLGWVHRFGKPEGRGYLLSHESKVKNYLTAFQHAGLDTKSVVDYFRKRLHGDPVRSELRMAEYAEWAKNLPPCPYKVDPDYKPFLGQEIKILD